VAYDSGSVCDFARRLRDFSRCFVRARLARLPKSGVFVGNVRSRRVCPVDLGARAVFVLFYSAVAKGCGCRSVGTLLNAGVCGGRAVRRVCHGELLVTTVTSNRRIEADRRQRRFATLAPSAHAERWAAKGSAHDWTG
jgi:hypothetical protein